MAKQKVTIPAKGIPQEKILEQMRRLRGKDINYDEGRIWALVFQVAEEHTAFLKECANTFFLANGMSPYAFPSLKKFETEVVSMTADILGGDDKVTGTMTSGGTESILLAVKAYRDWARRAHPEISEPEMVLPLTAHPAFEKGACYFNVKPVRVPVDKTFRVDLQAVHEAITPNTILLVGSAPHYPQGVIDPISELAAMAEEEEIGMHVDACVGGFILPWLRDLGRPIPAFDFRVPGVTSISADLHKYGYSARGASTILYRDAELRKHQFFVHTQWPGGYYASPSIPGSRPGGVIAAAWGALRHLGRNGYLRLAQVTMEATEKLQEGITQIEGLYIVGKPPATVFSFGSREEEVNIWAVGDRLEEWGWSIERQLQPPSLHLVVTPAHAPVVDSFLADLQKAVKQVRANPSLAAGGMAAMYGMMAQIPDREQVDEFLLNFLDQTYQTS